MVNSSAFRLGIPVVYNFAQHPIHGGKVMLRPTTLLTAIALTVLPGLSSAGQPFDGKWQTTVSCQGARDALGYSYRFVSDVKNGNFRGLHGEEGKPSSLLIEGTVSADGTGKLYATGRTGSKEFVPGRETPRGTEYSYSIEAHFNATTGTGTRVEGRPCSFQFEKK
jgi:hypothetical protein